MYYYFNTFIDLHTTRMVNSKVYVSLKSFEHVIVIIFDIITNFPLFFIIIFHFNCNYENYFS
jgi:hypothetical protein